VGIVLVHLTSEGYNVSSHIERYLAPSRLERLYWW
jgi:hypothetical protein